MAINVHLDCARYRLSRALGMEPAVRNLRGTKETSPSWVFQSRRAKDSPTDSPVERRAKPVCAQFRGETAIVEINYGGFLRAGTLTHQRIRHRRDVAILGVSAPRDEGDLPGRPPPYERDGANAMRVEQRLPRLRHD